MNIFALREKASSLHVPLVDQRTVMSRRRHFRDEDPLRIKNPFVSDEAKILSSKAFRVLSDRTQVFTSPSSPLIRDRKSHALEVAAVSVVIAAHLGLNVDLARAGALGHDIGHVPFGHAGERWIRKQRGYPNFCHEVFGVVIAQKIERRGAGLNLSWHTLEAMLRHSGKMACSGMSQEAWVVRYADKFAYVFHDMNDIVKRARYPLSKEVTDIANSFGASHRERTTTAIAGLIIESAECGHVSFETSDVAQRFARLRELMYEVYPKVAEQDVDDIMERALLRLSQLDVENPTLMLALMTDSDVAKVTSKKVRSLRVFDQTSISEIMPHLRKVGPIDICDPDLDWDGYGA